MSRNTFFAVIFSSLVLTGLPQVVVGNDDTAIENIKKNGGTVRSVAANDSSKEIDFHLSGKDLTDEQLADVAQVNDVIWLNLKDTKITDAGLKNLANLKI